MCFSLYQKTYFFQFIKFILSELSSRCSYTGINLCTIQVDQCKTRQFFLLKLIFFCACLNSFSLSICFFLDGSNINARTQSPHWVNSSSWFLARFICWWCHKHRIREVAGIKWKNTVTSKGGTSCIFHRSTIALLCLFSWKLCVECTCG